MKHKNSKKKCEKIHFAKRCLERIGVILDEKHIIEQIQHNALEFIGRTSNRVSKWLYDYMNKRYVVVYDKERKQVVTVYEKQGD